MIAYKKILLNNMLIGKKAKTWFANGLLSAEQMAKIIKNYPVDHYDPNIFIRLGLFIFMIFLVGAALGLYSLFTMAILLNGGDSSVEVYSIITSIIFGGVSFFFLEKFIQWKNWFGNGMDDALLYSGLTSIFCVIVFSISHNLNDEDAFLLVTFLYLPFLVVASMRYLDRFVSLMAVVCFYCMFFLSVMKMGPVAKYIMPFAFMALSAGFYFLSRYFLRDIKAVHYKGCLMVVKAVALIVFYISGNYYVIRESSVEFFGLDLSAGGDIPMAFVFYAFTAVVPLLYLFFGLKNRDRLMVWVALLLTAVAVLTFKYYFSLGHPEITLTLAGIVMVVLAYVSIKYLTTDKHGITFKDDPNEDNFLKTNAEALVIAQSFGASQVQTQSGVEMGGGDFGGGGSGGKF